MNKMNVYKHKRSYPVMTEQAELILRIAELEKSNKQLQNQLREANAYLKIYEVKNKKVMFKSKL